jgi:hypothetical protein
MILPMERRRFLLDEDGTLVGREEKFRCIRPILSRLVLALHADRRLIYLLSEGQLHGAAC